MEVRQIFAILYLVIMVMIGIKMNTSLYSKKSIIDYIVIILSSMTFPTVVLFVLWLFLVIVVTAFNITNPFVLEFVQFPLKSL